MKHINAVAILALVVAGAWLLEFGPAVVEAVNDI